MNIMLSRNKLSGAVLDSEAYILTLLHVPREASQCREVKIAARQSLPLSCRAITLAVGAVLKKDKKPSLALATHTPLIKGVEVHPLN